MSRKSRQVEVYNFIQDGQQCECQCCGGDAPPSPPLKWQLLFMIDSSACIDRYLMFGKSYYNQGSRHQIGQTVGPWTCPKNGINRFYFSQSKGRRSRW